MDNCKVCDKKIFRYRRTGECNECRWLREREDEKRRYGSGKLKKKLIKNTGNVCSKCGAIGNNKLHHIIPVSKGGRTVLENCILICKDCHKKEHGGRSVGP